MKCLGWNGDQRDRDFFRWKHEQNPFGRSPAWVAESAGRLAGFRTFLRWRFVHGTSGETLEMVRAVDTATDPDHQGRGIFRELTMSAIEELTDAGIDAVFNTPNHKSLPGYLKMGWIELGRPTVRIRPLSLTALPRIAGARAPAELWPDANAPTTGEPVDDLPSQVVPKRPTWRTDRELAFLEWRYRFEPLGYRQVRTSRGGCVYRIRRRGAAREVSICEFHGGSNALDREMRRSGDYALALGPTSATFGVPVPRQGPTVTWRPLTSAAMPNLRELDLTLSDLELF